MQSDSILIPFESQGFGSGTMRVIQRSASGQYSGQA